MSYFSQFYQIDVRESIAKEFTNSKGEVDDMMAGLHEIRVRMAEKEYNLKELEAKVKRNKTRFIAKMPGSKFLIFFFAIIIPIATKNEERIIKPVPGIRISENE